MYAISAQTGKRFVITDVVASPGKDVPGRIKAIGGTVLIAVHAPSKGEGRRKADRDWCTG